MNPNVIQFPCGHCQSWLTVPAHLAGVTGPCPKCGQQISSPRETQPQPQHQFQPQMPSAGVYTAPNLTPPIVATPPTDGYPAMSPPWGQSPQASQYASPMPVVPPQGPGSTGLSHGTSAPRPQQPALNAGMPPLWPGQQSASPLQPMQPVNPFPLSANPSQPAAPLNTPPVWAQPPFPNPPAAATPPPAPVVQMPWEQPTSSPPGNAGSGSALPASRSLPQAGESRPVTSAGSRLSLLARQLSTTAVLAQDLPQPDSIKPEDLAPAYSPVAPPDGSRARAAGDMMLKSNLRVGSGVRTSSSSSGSWLKTLATAAILCGLVGGIWYYRFAERNYLLSLLQPDPPISTTIVVAPPAIHAAPDSPKPKSESVVPLTAPEKVEVIPAPPMKKEAPTVASTPPAAETAPETQKPIAQPAVDSASVPRALVVPDEPMINSPVAQAPPPASEIRAGIPAPSEANGPNSPKALVEVNVHENMATASGQAQTSSQPSPLVASPKINNCPPAAKAALEGLLGFLGADSLAHRLPFIQQVEGIQAKAEQYYRTNPDGPILVNEINYLRRDANPEVGQGTHTVFVVDSRSWAYPIPVMLEETEAGARVDWLSFVEFKDDLLKRFFSGYIDQPARFHVAIRRTHYFNDNVPDLDNKECFEITNLGTINGHVFVPKPSPLATSLAGSITWDKASVFPIVELQWRKEPGYQWIEMTAVPQLNWYSAISKPAPSL